jgi:hypothetical protein
MFTTPCFIRKNTQELRDKLIEIGYSESAFYHGDLSNLCVNVLLDGEYDEANDYAPLLSNAIDCIENEERFLAIAALRDDSDYMQWLTCAEVPEFTLCTKNSIDEHFMDSFPNELYRKATVEELIKHFK